MLFRTVFSCSLSPSAGPVPGDIQQLTKKPFHSTVYSASMILVARFLIPPEPQSPSPVHENPWSTWLWAKETRCFSECCPGAHGTQVQRHMIQQVLCASRVCPGNRLTTRVLLLGDLFHTAVSQTRWVRQGPIEVNSQVSQAMRLLCFILITLKMCYQNLFWTIWMTTIPRSHMTPRLTFELLSELISVPSDTPGCHSACTNKVFAVEKKVVKLNCHTACGRVEVL